MPNHHPHHPHSLRAVTGAPAPCPPSPYLNFPTDHYAHSGAPSEWWWHVGTLYCDGRAFGFEINAQTFLVPPVGSVYFAEVMLTDVANNLHYSQVATVVPSTPWAETDPSKPWYVRLGDSKDSAQIAMSAAGDPAKNMIIEATLVDPTIPNPTPITLSLSLSQQGSPLLVWGTGVEPAPPAPGGLTENNYYYSFTRLEATGTITIGSESFPVSGLTWMDHEYGLFGTAGKPPTWFLQTMQLDNGVHIHHYCTFPDQPPQPGQTVPSIATVQTSDGKLYSLVDCTMTAGNQTWQSPSGATYFLNFTVEIPDFNASFSVTSLVDNQLFIYPGGKVETYEGVAWATGTFEGMTVSGTAWIEEAVVD